MRSTRIAAALVLALGVSIVAEDARAATVVVPKVGGTRRDRKGWCRTFIKNLVGDAHRRSDPASFEAGRLRPSGDDLAATSDWLREGASITPEVQVAILGTLFGKKLRIDVYSLPDGKLVGLKTFAIRKGCKLSTRKRRLAAQWLNGLVEANAPEPLEIAAAGGDASSDSSADAPVFDGAAAEIGRGMPVQTDPLLDIEALLATPPGDASDLGPAEELPQEIAADTPAPPPSALELPILAFDVGIALAGRTWTYVDPQTANLRDYRLDLMPAPTFRLEVHPFAAFGVEALDAFGIVGSYKRSIGVESARPEGGARFPTVFTEWEARLRYRWPLGTSEDGAVLYPEAGFHASSFALGAADDGTREPDLPDVAYSSVGLGISTEIRLAGRAAVFGSAAYLIGLPPGAGLAPGEFFADSSASGFRLGGGLRFYVAGPLSVQAGASFLRYFLAFDSKAGDMHAAAGAHDQFLSLVTALRFEN